MYYGLAKGQFEKICQNTAQPLIKRCANNQIEELMVRIRELRESLPNKQTPISMSMSTRLSPMYTSSLTPRFTSNSMVLPGDHNTTVRLKPSFREALMEDSEDDLYQMYSKFEMQVKKLSTNYGLAVAFSIVPMDDDQSSPSIFSSDESFLIVEGDDFSLGNSVEEDANATSKEDPAYQNTNEQIQPLSNFDISQQEYFNNTRIPYENEDLHLQHITQGTTDDNNVSKFLIPSYNDAKELSEEEMGRSHKREESFKRAFGHASSSESSIGEITDSREDIQSNRLVNGSWENNDFTKEINNNFPDRSETPTLQTIEAPTKLMKYNRRKSLFRFPFFRSISGKKKEEPMESGTDSLESSTAQITVDSQLKIKQLETQIATLQKQLEQFQTSTLDQDLH